MNKLIFIYYIFITILSFFIGIYFYEKLNFSLPYKNDLLRDSPILAENTVDLRTLDYYPYTGWHLLSNFNYNGPLIHEKVQYKETNIRTGDQGFFIDFNLKSPPVKKQNEFRIILVGGSGAMGMGAQSNEKMFYKLLEKKINNELNLDKKVRVINLSMAGSVLFQNFITLNKWAHSLNPDLIICYNGYNDIVIPIINESDSFLRFNEFNGLTLLLRGSEYPKGYVWLSEYFPKTFNSTGLGQAMKMLFFQNYFFDLGKKRFKENSNSQNLNTKEIYNDVVLKNTINSLKSIKRDFEGIPIMFVLQISDEENANLYANDLGPDYYNNFFDTIQSNLTNYINKDWIFLNAHKKFENRKESYFGIHLANEGHEILAELLKNELKAFLLN